MQDLADVTLEHGSALLLQHAVQVCYIVTDRILIPEEAANTLHSCSLQTFHLA